MVNELPHKPGVYLYKDRLNRVIYVGKARDLHKRVSQYFHPSRRMGWDPKLKALMDSVYDFEVHVVRSEPEALLLEGKLIKDFRPRYNISFRDDKKFLLVKVNLNDAIPRFVLTRMKKDDGSRYFGPYAHSGALRSSLMLLKKKYHLRSCRAHTPGEREYKHCLDHAIKICSAPCVNKITMDEYKKNIIKACDALEGKNDELVTDLHAEMKDAAVRLDFEKAASLRDMIQDLQKTSKFTRKFARPLPRSINPKKDLSDLGDILGLEGPPRIIECFDISNISNTHIVASMVCFRDGFSEKNDYRRYRIRSVEIQNDFASMAEVIRRRYARVLIQQIRRPNLIVVDGGKGQISSALEELKKLGLDSIPLIGLAKEFEEIYRPFQPHPLQLPKDSGALKLLQRIRDEAHRFANGYHQLLLKKRVEESLLDEIPGISERKKIALLTKFGSIKRIKTFTPEEISTIDGISLRLARDIKTWLLRNSQDTFEADTPAPED